MQRYESLCIAKSIRTMKEKENFWVMMANETGWGETSVKQKLILCWFGASFVFALGTGGSLLLSIAAVINLGISAYAVRKHIPMEDE